MPDASTPRCYRLGRTVDFHASRALAFSVCIASHKASLRSHHRRTRRASRSARSLGNGWVGSCKGMVSMPSSQARLLRILAAHTKSCNLSKVQNMAGLCIGSENGTNLTIVGPTERRSRNTPSHRMMMMEFASRHRDGSDPPRHAFFARRDGCDREHRHCCSYHGADTVCRSVARRQGSPIAHAHVRPGLPDENCTARSRVCRQISIAHAIARREHVVVLGKPVDLAGGIGDLRRRHSVELQGCCTAGI